MGTLRPWHEAFSQRSNIGAEDVVGESLVAGGEELGKPA
jgi:hypothetical protein